MDIKTPRTQFSKKQVYTTELSVGIDDLSELIRNIKFRQIIADAKNKELVLFIGITGSGKSTCISYLLGAGLEKKRMLGGRKCAVLSPEQSSDKRFPKIGAENYKSCTLYSEVFDDDLSGLSFCDTAGFLDTRSEEEQICASLSIQLAVQSAKAIRGVVVVIEWGIFDPKTSTDLKELMSALAQLIKGPYEDISESFIFLINKVPEDVDKNDLICLVSEYKSELDKNIAAITSKMHQKNIDLPQIEQLNRTALLIDLLKTQLEKRPENVVLMNVFDKGECRGDIHKLLSSKQCLITQERFNFKSFDKKRMRFDAELDEVAKKGIELIEHYFELLSKKEEIEKNKANAKASKDYYAAFNNFLTANDHAVFDSMKKRFIELTKKEIDRLSDEVKTCGKKIINLKEKNLALLSEKHTLNRPDRDLVYEDSYSELVAPTLSDLEWSKIFFRSEKRFVYPVKVPFLTYEPSGNGSFDIHKNNPSLGLCEVTYTSCFGENAEATFKVYSEKRLIPKNADRISQINDEVPKNENKMETNDRKIKAIGIEVEELKSLLLATEDTKFEEGSLQRKKTEKKFLEHFKSNELSDDVRTICLVTGTMPQELDAVTIYFLQSIPEAGESNISVYCHSQNPKQLDKKTSLSLIKLRDFPDFPKKGQNPVKILRDKSSVLFHKVVSLCGYIVTDVKKQKEKFYQEITFLEEKITNIHAEIDRLKDESELMKDLSDLFVFSHTVNNFLKDYASYRNRCEEENTFALVNAEKCIQEVNDFDVQVILLAKEQEVLGSIQDKLETIQRGVCKNTYHYEKTKTMILLCRSFRNDAIVWAKLREVCYQLFEISRSYPEKSEEINIILKSVLFHALYQPKLDEPVLGELLAAFVKHFGHEARDLAGNTFLHAAVEVDSLCLVGGLLKLEGSVTAKNIQGQTPFFVAIRDKRYNLANAILEHGQLNLHSEADLLVDARGNHVYQYLLDDRASLSKATLNEILSVSQLLSKYSAKYPVEAALRTEAVNPFIRLVKGLRLGLTLVIDSFDESIWEYKFLMSILNNLNGQERQSCLLIGHSNTRLIDSLLSNHGQSPNIVAKSLETFVLNGSMVNKELLTICILAGNYELSSLLLSRWKPPVNVNFLLPDKKTLLGLVIWMQQNQLVELLLKYQVNIHQALVYDFSALTEDQVLPESTDKIKKNLHLSEQLMVGKVSKEGRFIEAFAKVANSLVGAKVYSEKSLCELCYQYYQKNPEKVESLYSVIGITADYDEIRHVGKGGDPQVEGIILCRMLGLKVIYLAKTISDLNQGSELIFEYYAITQNGVSSIKKREIPEGVPLLVKSTNGGYVPIIKQYPILPLRLCILENNIAALSLLFNSRQKINLRETDQYGCTLFHTAALMGNLEILKILENKLISSEKFEWLLDVEQSGSTPLSLSIKHGHVHCTEWFFEIINKYSQCHPEKAAYRDRVLSVADKQGQTPLIVAVKSHNPAVVQACLSQNTNSFWSKQEGDQAFQLALSDQGMPADIVNNIRQSKMAHCITLVKAHTQMLLSHDTFHAAFLPRWMIQLEKVFHEPAYKQYQDRIMSASMSSLQTMAERLAISISHAIREKYHSEDHKVLLQTNCKDSSYHAWDQLIRHAIDRTLLIVTEQLQQTEKCSNSFWQQSSVKNDKHRAFTRALKEALRNYFYVSRALYEGKVLMNDEGFNAFKAAFNIASPFATEMASSLTTLNVGVIGSFVSAALELITRLKDAQYQCEAGRFVQAFGLCQPDAIEKYEKDISIDHDKLKAVAEALYRRYRDQIQQCTLSKEAEVSIRLSKTDGIYVLANVIADRIFQHMIKKGSIKVDDERTFKAQVADWWTTLGADKDIYYELSLMSLPERCIMAVLHESIGDDKDMHVRTDIWLRNGCKTEDIWMAGGILVKSGLKLERNPNELYIRKGGVTQESLHAKYGYCYVSESMLNLKEIEKRGFVKASLSQTDMFANQLSEVEQKTVAPCFIM